MDKWFDDGARRESIHRSSHRKSFFSLMIASFFKNISTTNWIIIANVVLFIVFSIIIGINADFADYIALKPAGLFQGKIWLLLTSMFMHVGLAHLFINMFSLAFIGNFLEKIIGRKRFFIFYIIAGLTAGLFYSVLAYYLGGFLPNVFGTINTNAVGASGAIFGLLGLLAVLTPKARVYLVIGPLIAIALQSVFQVFSSNAIINIINVLITIYFFISIFALLSFSRTLMKIAIPIEMPFWISPIIAIVPLVIISFFVNLPIGNTAHLGGLIAGLIFGWYLRTRYRKKIMLLNRMIGAR